jgi:hypothetical protein
MGDICSFRFLDNLDIFMCSFMSAREETSLYVFVSKMEYKI